MGLNASTSARACCPRLIAWIFVAAVVSCFLCCFLPSTSTTACFCRTPDWSFTAAPVSTRFCVTSSTTAFGGAGMPLAVQLFCRAKLPAVPGAPSATSPDFLRPNRRLLSMPEPGIRVFANRFTELRNFWRHTYCALDFALAAITRD